MRKESSLLAKTMLPGPLTRQLLIGIHPGGVTLLRTGGWFSRKTTLLAENDVPAELAGPPEMLTECLDALLATHHLNGSVTRIVLADDLVRLFIVTPPRNTDSLQDCQAAAAQRFHALYDAPLANWHLRADWNASTPFLACAMPRTLLDPLQRMASARRLTLMTVTPNFVAAWNSWHRRLSTGDWLGVLQGETLTLGMTGRNGKLLNVRATPIPSGATLNPLWLTAHVARESLRFDIPAPPRLHLCGDMPAEWSVDSREDASPIWLGQQPVARSSVSLGAALAASGFRS